MKYRTFGRLGWQISEIGFGAWAIGGSWGEQSEDDSLKALHTALDAGCNFIDTAQVYGNGRSEQLIGKVLRERKDGRRIYVATKIPPGPGQWVPSPYDAIADRFPEKYLRERVELSLRQLQTDCLDLLQLHTWTRAWNGSPSSLETLRQLQKEGKILGIGISTPEHDQNCLVELMRGGWLDAVQVIYNIFEQEPVAEFLPAAQENGVGVIVRVAFDEGVLTGKFSETTTFPKDDFRSNYFAGDRLARAVRRVAKIKETVGVEADMAATSLQFVLKHPAVSTVIPGIRNERQARLNCGVSDLPPMTDGLALALRKHAWNRAFWYSGK